MKTRKAFERCHALTSTKVLAHLSKSGPATSDSTAAALGLSCHRVQIAIGYLCHEAFAKQVRKVDVPGRPVPRWSYDITPKGRARLEVINTPPREKPEKPKLRAKPIAPVPASILAEPSRPAVAAGHVETVEEFLAKGGRIEKLPVQWQAPTRYPRVGGLS